MAKIAIMKLCESYNRQYGASHGVDYRCVMSTNFYGPGYKYQLENSHVIPVLIRRFHEGRVNHAASVLLLGTGRVRCEFLYVDDMAAASVHVMNLDKATHEAHTSPMQSYINVGCGEDVTIAELARLVAHTVDYTGALAQDTSKPDGAQLKLTNSQRLASLGWRAHTPLTTGLQQAYADFLKNPT